jgi:AMP deaminase
VAFDSVDDESSYEEFFLQDLKTVPKDWNYSKNPHYAYWIYYIYSNITSLNLLRKYRNLNMFAFRPHCGEAGNVDHLISAFLLSDGINHGIILDKSPVLMYLFYLK